MAITDFIKSSRSEADLRTALEVIREFKECENQEEWLAIPFVAWVKLEQLQEFLEHMVEKAPLRKDTVSYIDRVDAGT